MDGAEECVTLMLLTREPHFENLCYKEIRQSSNVAQGYLNLVHLCVPPGLATVGS